MMFPHTWCKLYHDLWNNTNELRGITLRVHGNNCRNIMSLEGCSVTCRETLQVNLTADSLAGYLFPWVWCGPVRLPTSAWKSCVGPYLWRTGAMNTAHVHQGTSLFPMKRRWQKELWKFLALQSWSKPHLKSFCWFQASFDLVTGEKKIELSRQLGVILFRVPL